MSGLVAILRVAALRAVRSPLVLVSGLGAAALWAAFPPLDGLPPHEAVRQGAAYVVYGAALATGAAAVVCALRAPALEPDAPALRLRGPRIATAGELGAIALFACGVAAACGIGGLTWLRAVGCDPNGATDVAALRDVVWTNRDAIVLGPGETFALDLPAAEIPSEGATLEIAPHVRRVRDGAATRPSAAAVGAVVVRRRAKGGAWRREEIRLRRGAPARVVLRGTEEGRPPSDVEVRVDAPRDATVVVPAGAAAVLGSRAPATSSLLRAALVVAFGSVLAAATVRFFRGLVGPPIAIAAATTLALAAAAVGELEASPSWLRAVATRLPGGGGDDPAAALIAGRCVGWGDVGRAALRAASASLAAILCARRPSEPRG